jgi:hypothetical protein
VTRTLHDEAAEEQRPALPETFVLPELPPALQAWFALGAQRGENIEVLSPDGVLDDLGVIDRASARRALTGYRWTWSDAGWTDEARRAGWPEHWIVLDAIEADPIIADISSPDVPVLTARHGMGSWDPHPLAGSVAEYVDALQVRRAPEPATFDEPLPEWSVWALDLGVRPLQTLVALGRWSLFPPRSRPETIALSKAASPVRLASGLTSEGARLSVAFGARHGARLEARRDR